MDVLFWNKDIRTDNTAKFTNMRIARFRQNLFVKKINTIDLIIVRITEYNGKADTGNINSIKADSRLYKSK